MILLISLPVVAGCSYISSDPPFHWARQAWLLQTLSTGCVSLTMKVASAGPSEVSPHSSRTEDLGSEVMIASLSLLAILLLMYASLWFTFFAVRAHCYLNIQPCLHCNFYVLSSIGRLDFDGK